MPKAVMYERVVQSPARYAGANYPSNMVGAGCQAVTNQQ